MGIKQVFVQALTEVRSSAQDTLGDIRRDGNLVYKYVKLLNDTATAAVVAGDVLCYDAAVGHSTNVVVMDLGDADTVRVGAGIGLGAVAGVADTAYFIWIQIEGPAIGAKVVPGADGGLLTMADATVDGTFTPRDAATQQICGIATDQSAKLIACTFPR